MTTPARRKALMNVRDGLPPVYGKRANYRFVARLMDAGLIDLVGIGIYELTDKGRRALEASGKMIEGLRNDQ